VIAVQNSEN
ncbi:CX9C domain-containing protein, partial [Caenorhabditis elegans]